MTGKTHSPGVDQAFEEQAAKVVRAKAEDGVRSLLAHIGEDVSRPGIIDTPKRVAKAWYEMTWGSRLPEDEFRASINRTFPSTYDEMVCVDGIPFVSLCEHHVSPFVGIATVAYIPEEGGQVIGLSKLARIVEYYAARLQIQEQMTKQIADCLEELLKPKGVGVWVRAEHTCMTARGVKAHGSATSTTDLRGAIREDGRARSEFMAIARATLHGG